MVRRHGALVIITGMAARSSAKAAGATAAEQPFTSEVIAAALLLAAARPFVKARRSAVETLSAARGASNRAALPFAVAAEWKVARPLAEVAGHNSAAAAKVAVRRCAAVAAVTLAAVGLAEAVAPAVVVAPAAAVAPAAVVGPAAAVVRAEAAAADDKWPWKRIDGGHFWPPSFFGADRFGSALSRARRAQARFGDISGRWTRRGCFRIASKKCEDGCDHGKRK
jgi:hypothetical protein